MKHKLLLSVVGAISLLSLSAASNPPEQKAPEGDAVPRNEIYIKQEPFFKNGLVPLPQDKVIAEPMPLPDGEFIPTQLTSGII